MTDPSRLSKRDLQLLAADPEVREALAVLRDEGVTNGSIFQRLINTTEQELS